VSANRSSAGERSHRALIPHANFRKRAPLVPFPRAGGRPTPPSIPSPPPARSSASFVRLVLLHSGDNPLYCFSNRSLSRAPASAGNAPIEASAGKISKFPSRVHRPSPEHRVIAKENGSPREIKDDPNGSWGPQPSHSLSRGYHAIVTITTRI